MKKYKDEIINFTKRLGVLPVYFMHSQDDDSKYALLNGEKNNFCIDFKGEFNREIYRNYAWSANINNFISVSQNKCHLHSIDNRNCETIDYSLVVNNLPKFYDYLGSKNISKNESVISHVLGIYRKLRNVLREINGNESLSAFLYLLSNMESNEVDINAWGLPIQSKAIVDTINKSLWEELVLELRSGIINEYLKPNLSLILRHAAGRLFEEANYIAQFGVQLDLFPSHLIKYDYHPKQVGAYFTPSHISRSIVEESLFSVDELPPSIKIFDPACGAGEFLVESLRQLKAKGYNGKIKVIGWDIAQTALDMAQYTLTFEKREWGDNLDITELELKDSLEHKWPKDVDFIFMNPPYISWEQMKSDIRNQTKSIIGSNCGRPNLAGVFYFLASQSLNNTGVIGCLIPSSVLNSDSHKEIRNITKNILHPVIIGRLGSYIFENAFVDACLIVASRKQKSDNTKILWTQNVEDAASKSLRELRKQQFYENATTAEKNYSLYNIPTKEIMDNDSWMPMSYSSAKFKMLLEFRVKNNIFTRVENIFNVMQGARTGLNKVFIVNSETYNSFSHKEKRYFRPSIDSSSLKNGKLIKSNYIFFPYSENLDNIETENDLEKFVPHYYRSILKPNKDILERRKGIDMSKWWTLTRPRTWQMQARPKLVSTEFGKSGNFGFDKSGEYVVERGCAWFFKDELNSLDNRYYAYLAIFNSKVMNSLLDIYSRQLAGGSWYILDSKNVGKIPLPILEKIDEEIVVSLIEFGLRIINQEDFNQEEMDYLIEKIYNL